MGASNSSGVNGKEFNMSDKDTLYDEIGLQKAISEWENIITQNLNNLARALRDAADGRFMSQEHAKIIWKSYLSVSGMDIPKDLKSRVLKIIEDEKSSKK